MGGLGRRVGWRLTQLLFVLLCLTSSAGAQLRSSILAIRDATVVDVVGGSLQPNQTVLVDNHRIAAVGPAERIPIPSAAEVVEGAGKFLIPGLWDMHVHTLYEGRPEFLFPMFVANGVTGVREMGSAWSLEEIARVRAQIARGELTGPRFGSVAGKIFDGPGRDTSPRPEFESISTPEQAREMVRSYRRRGADFIKVYDNLSRDAYYAIANEAKQQGLYFAGHVPDAVSSKEASDAGQRSFEHLWQPPFACFASSVRELREALADQDVPASEIEEIVADWGPADCASLFASYIANETWQVPTLTRMRVHLRSADTELWEDARLKYVPIAYRERWESRMSRRRREHAGETPEWWQALRLLGTMHRAGVPILAGTDTGLGNDYTFAGFSLHDELELLVEAGLTPLDALRCATLNPTRSLGRGDEFGSIAAGKLADLVLLDANPLENIHNTQRIHAVVADGRLYRRADLDRLLVEVAARSERRGEEN